MPSVGRFEGVYGGLYDRAIQTDALRRLAPLAYGPVPAVLDLDRLAAEVVRHTPRRGTVLDVPSGGAPLIPRLARAGFRGRVVALDLAEAMLARARRRAAATPSVDVEIVHGDAEAMELADRSVDAAVSLNGIHCLPDPPAFVSELARVLRPGARALVVTLVSGADPRTDAVIAAGRLTGIIPARPPSRDELEAMLRESGFAGLEDLGGRGLIAVAAVRAGSG